MYALVKQLDDHKQTISTVEQLFDVEIMSIRSQLVEQSEALIFQPNITIGKKSREVLWRKGYYDFISITKRIRTAEAKQQPTITGPDLQLMQLMQLINEGISKYKAIIVRLERSYQLDLRNIVDFTLLDQSSMKYEDSEDGTFTLEMINFTLETVHAALLSLGDLHRYFIDFNFDQPRCMHRDDAARFYFEAFKLNPKIGMAQNQLGTLYSGQNYNLDSTYHYLYSLVCRVPFELSENNVAKIFAANSEHLELVDMDKMGVSVCDFLARFKLIADIFFYDKDVTDFNALCHRMLIDLRTLLTTKRSQLNAELLFKVVAILFFCMTKLKARESTKLYSLNAFLVAICSELIDACIVHLEKFIDARVKQNEAFQDSYGVYFELFDRDVRRSRETHHRILNGGGVSTDDAALQNGKRPMNIETNKSSQASIESASSAQHKSVAPIDNSNNNSKRNSLDNEAGASGSSASTSGGGNKDKDYSSTDAKTPSSLPLPDKKVIKKKPVKLRRRRKKLNSCDTDYESDEVSESDYDMDSDFSSDESSLVDSDSSSSSDDDDFEKSDKEATMKNEGDVTLTGEILNYSDSDDIIVEEEKLVYMKDMLADNYNSLVSKMWPSADAEEDDIVIEEESITFNSSGRSSVASGSPTAALENSNSADVLKEISNLIISPLNNDTKDEPSRAQSAAEKLRYKRKYTKIDPNILIDFAHQECTLHALKILFDWLKINQDILQNCYSSNPEFVHKIMKLMNHFNIDIFTRKVCFDRGLIKCAEVRSDLRSLFDIRISIPLREDILLKDFPILEAVQQPVDFELPLQMAITDNEENILRILKLVDFGFFVCKSKKFRYNFCARSRKFTEAGGSGGGGRGHERQEGINGGRTREKRQRRNDRRRGFVQRKSENGRRGKRQRQRNSYTSNDDIDLAADGLTDAGDGITKVSSLPKKSYLKNRTLQLTLEKENQKLDNGDVAIVNGSNGSIKKENKYEIMGKLWLRNEVKTLESKVSKKPDQNFTPYLVMDTMALTDFATIVKSLIKTKKFVVLVPNAGNFKYSWAFLKILLILLRFYSTL